MYLTGYMDVCVKVLLIIIRQTDLIILPVFVLAFAYPSDGQE